MPDIHTMHK